MLKRKMNVFAFHSVETEHLGTEWKETVCTKAEELSCEVRLGLGEMAGVNGINGQ